LSFHLTRRAILDLKSIYIYSVKNWGEEIAEKYLDEIYEVFLSLVENPDAGKIWKKRAFPFRMVPAGKHFAVYGLHKNQIVIITVLHGNQNIENILHQEMQSLIDEIESIKNQLD